MWRLAILSSDIAVLRCTTLYCEHVAVQSGHRQSSVTVPQNPNVSDEITVTYQGSTKISEMKNCWYKALKGIAVEAFEKHSVSKRKDDNTFKSQCGQGNPRGAPRQHQNKTGMKTVGLKAQLQSNHFKNLEYQKAKVSGVLHQYLQH
ncbi:hypothetical protein RRG08_001322 [Elysia crispata]|uniref:Uncharacterized protein n=1 Tax=Elysia crispata TaxID=231223 RepID=A0AAE0ZRT4_9GAST|nr:hypothetical protein RRG08_001322 [Elysia crispata]